MYPVNYGWFFAILSRVILVLLPKKVRARVRPSALSDLVPALVDRRRLPVELGGAYQYDPDAFLDSVLRSHVGYPYEYFQQQLAQTVPEDVSLLRSGAAAAAGTGAEPHAVKTAPLDSVVAALEKQIPATAAATAAAAGAAGDALIPLEQEDVL